MFKLEQKPLKSKAQAIIEACIAIILAFLFFMFVIEFGLYYQNLYSNQTLSDDINANITSYVNDNPDENFCKNPDIDTINAIDDRVKKYLDKNLELRTYIQNSDILILKSTNNLLTINILCSPAEGYIVRSEYLYKGLFIFRFGQLISSISSVQTPRF